MEQSHFHSSKGEMLKQRKNQMKKQNKNRKKKEKNQVNKGNLDGRHISHDTFSGETFVDNFNIDFIRYFRVKSFIVAFIYSIIGAVLYFGSERVYGFFWGLEFGMIFLVFFVLALTILCFLFTVSFLGTGSVRKSLRNAGRRGFYSSFTLILAFFIVLFVSGNFSWDQEFYVLVRNFFSAIIVMALLSLPVDWAITFATDVMSEREFSELDSGALNKGLSGIGNKKL